MSVVGSSGDDDDDDDDDDWSCGRRRPVCGVWRTRALQARRRSLASTSAASVSVDAGAGELTSVDVAPIGAVEAQVAQRGRLSVEWGACARQLDHDVEQSSFFETPFTAEENFRAYEKQHKAQ